MLCADELAVTLTEYVSSSSKCKIFPNELKHADISPLSQMKDDLIKAFFNDMLSAYLKKYVSEHVLIKLVDSWKDALDDNQFASTILIDLSKALYYVPQRLLIAKMKALLKWIPQSSDLEQFLFKIFMNNIF